MSHKKGSLYRWTAHLGRDTYIVRRGKYKGAYHIYSTEEAFRKDHPHVVLKHWSQGEVGDYVWTDCGRIVPVLSRTVLQSKRRKQRPTIAIRVPHGTAGYYQRVDGTSSSQLVLELMRGKASGRSSMEKNTTYKTGKHFTKKKKRFASLLAQGAAPHRAYMMAWGERDIPRAKRTSRALLREEGDLFMAEIKKAYDEIFDQHGMSQEDIAQKLVELAGNARSPKAALDAIGLILELRGERVGQNMNVNVNIPPPLPTAGGAPISSPNNIPPRELPSSIVSLGKATPETSSSASSSDDSESATKPPSPSKTSPAEEDEQPSSHHTERPTNP